MQEMLAGVNILDTAVNTFSSRSTASLPTEHTLCSGKALQGRFTNKTALQVSESVQTRGAQLTCYIINFQFGRLIGMAQGSGQILRDLAWES